MSVRNRLILAAVVIVGWPWVVAAPGIANYRPVTDQRLGNPSMPNWLMYRGTYNGWGFHPADLINTTNVKHLVPLDAKTGQVVWDKTVDDSTKGYYMTLAPLVAKGKVLVGVAGGEYGMRGYIAASDARTVDQLWKTYTIPGPGEPGHDTWSGESWRTGGASAWMTGRYDPFLNLAYWGTASATPWPADAHPGDNLHANSVLALDVDTGKLQAHFQYEWNASSGWDEVSTPLLIRLPRDGHTIDALVHPACNSYLWLLQRSADAITFLDPRPYVKQNVFTSIDPQTGRPSYHPVLSRVRCQDRRGDVGVPHQLRRDRCADLLREDWHTVSRGAVRLGRGGAGDADAAQRCLGYPNQRAARRGRLGVWAAGIGRG